MPTLQRLWQKLLRSLSGAAREIPDAGIVEEDFDAAWYLRTYPDIAAAGVDPWRHFVGHGRTEGRLPCPNRAVVYEYHLWRGAQRIMLPKLAALESDPNACNEERLRAAAVLERWNAAVAGEAAAGMSRGVSPVDCRAGIGAERLAAKELVRQSGWFDALWYLEQYPDIQETAADPFEHFWHIGSREGRDPGPGFSTSGYRYRYPDSDRDGLPALAHYLSEGREKGYEALPAFTGKQRERPGAPVLVVCAHQAGKYLYGAERSLLDILSALSTLPVNLVATLPSAVNAEYLEDVRSRVGTVVVLPYRWWNAQRPSCLESRSNFERILKKYRASALYANTLVLDEPLLAARNLDIPVLAHIREMPLQDEALCRALGADLEVISGRICKLVDVPIFNSATAANAMGMAVAPVVPNTVDVESFAFASGEGARENRPLRVALISSNLPKKGLADFVTLAGLLEQRAAAVQCVLIGQENEHIHQLRTRQSSGELQNLILAGYAATPQEALEQADVVVNLSHFQESFGRTLLEAMAAAKPVVAYHWGALAELVVDGVTGYLVPFGDQDGVADKLVTLAADNELRRELGLAGRARAAREFSRAVVAERLGVVLKGIGVLGA